MKIINLTPHDIHVRKIDGSFETIKREGTIARVATSRTLTDTIDGIEIYVTRFSGVIGLPPTREDTRFVVSRIVQIACRNRGDLLCPEDLIRNDKGNVDLFF